MKSMMKKNSLREIRDSFSRWIAILAIVALGVGFFCGLKVCKEAFLLTGNTYIDRYNLFDFQLISTLGIEDKNVDTIKNLDGVKTAEGSYSKDVLITVEGEDSGERVAATHSVTDSVNKLSLKQGKMPSKANQCVGDAERFSKDDIGKTIYISSDNDKDTKSFFKYDAYTLVGIAESPVYLNFERGSTSLGDGNVSCFLYIPAQGFDSDVFTEMYVDLEETAFIYSDKYDEITDSMEDKITDSFEVCAQERYDEIISDANKELEDARKKVDDGKAEIEKNEAKLADSENELKQAEKDYAEGLDEYNSQKKDAYDALDESLAQVESMAGTEYYEPAMAQYTQAKAEADGKFEAAYQELKTAKDKIDEGKNKVADGRAEINKAKKKLNDAEADLDSAEKEIADIEAPDTYVLTRSSNIGYSCFENDSNIVDGIAKVFPVFFFLVAALVCMTTMTRMIDEQRTQIGILKALGYKKSQIMWKYIFYSGSAALLGGVGGFIGGSYLFPWVIWQAYSIMYGFANLTFVISTKLGFWSVLVALVCCIGTTLYSCYEELSEVPAQLIRPKAPALGKRILLERIPFIWNRFKFLHKVSIRNIFRYKKRFFMMVLGICGCTALLVTGMGIKDSIADVVSSQYDEILHYDYAVSFAKDLSPRKQEEFISENSSVISDCLFLYTGSVDAHTNEMIKSVSLVVCNPSDPTEKFIDLHSGEEKIPYPAENEGVINSNLAQTLGLDVGDELTVYDSDMRELNVRISALCDNYVYNYLYISEATYENYYGTPQINSAFVIGIQNEEGIVENPHEDGALLMNADNVSSVSITKDFRDRINNMMKSLDYVVALVIASAGALAFIVLYNLTNINITERIREIATIKVLGFYPNETSSYVFRENIVLTAISALVGLPLGTWLHSFVMEQVKIDLLSFDIHIEPLSYILGIIVTFVFAIIVNFVMYFKLEKISMTESLKSIE